MLVILLLHGAVWALVTGSAAYFVLALASVAAFAAPPQPLTPRPQRTTVMRPLCGGEPGLEEGLESLLSQAVDDECVRFVFGVATPRDPALVLAQRVAARHPSRRVTFVADAAVHGTNPKVSNLINMSAAGLDPLVVVTDSDVVLPPGSLQRLINAAAPEAVGAITALSRGRPHRGASRSQQFGALYLDGWFLPTALLHARLGPATVCYGQLTAIKREVLPGGGFEALADVLADDTELGHLARRAGRLVLFAPDVVEVWVNDDDFPALFNHELRWARTIRALQPIGYAASVFMHPGPLPWLLTFLEPTPIAWAAVLSLPLLRWLLMALTHARLGRARGLCQTNGRVGESGRGWPMARPLPPSPFRRFNSSPEVIRLVVMMYVRYPLSLRNVEDLLHERGIEVSHETVRFWWNRFGPMFAAEIRRKRVEAMRQHTHWRWHLDEVYVRINGVQHYLWRAVDHEGEVLESFVTKERDKAAALQFIRKALKRHGSPKAMTTDGLRSYGAALRELGAEEKREVGRWANNRVENSHQPFRRRERAMARFRRMHTLQKFSAVHASFHNHFNQERHLTSRDQFRERRSAALAEWRALAA